MNQLIHGKAIDNEGLEAIEVLKIKVNSVVERVMNEIKHYIIMRRKFKFFIFITYILSYCFMYSQSDSLSLNLKGFGLKIKGGHLYQFKNINAEPVIPELFDQRKYIGDQPLQHGVGWIEFNTNYNRYGFNISADIIGEHRGLSYGVFDKNNFIVYPRILLGFDSNFTIFNQKFYAGVSVGHYVNKKIMEGLQIYNMDWVGNEFYLKWKNLKITYNTIGDLMYWIGLNIGDGNILSLKYEDLEIMKGYYINIAYCLFSEDQQYLAPGFYVNSLSENYSISVKHDNFRLYSEFGIRNTIPYQPDEFRYKTGLLVGFEYNYNHENIKLKLNSEYRYYGYQFNLGFRDTAINSYTTGTFGTIGRNYYPIYLYDRSNFSQWAVFTDYQSRNIEGYSLNADIDWYFYDKFILFGEFDINAINAFDEKIFVYPFYRSGIGFQPVDGANIKLSLTNRMINLDKHYPTLYLMNNPAVMISLNYNFSLLKN